MTGSTMTHEQHPSSLLSMEENETIFSLFSTKCESLATTVVQVFASNPPEHCEWFKLETGVLCLIKDHFKRSYYFRLYCPDRRMMLWEHEVYNSMQFNALKPYLHTFEAQDCIIAFNFASEEEASYLRSILLGKLESKKQRRERRNRNSFHPRERSNHKYSPHISNGSVPVPPERYSSQKMHTQIPGGASFNHMEEKKKSKKKYDKKPLTKADIGIPSNFRHISHVGWDVNKGFDANLGKEESPELIEFFQQAGVSDRQLEDRETRDFIYQFIERNGGLDRVVDEVLQVPNQGKVRKDHQYAVAQRSDRNGIPAPPPLPMRNTPLASRAAPPPPPLRTVPAPPPPTQLPAPPPPLRTLTTTSGGGPPPPPLPPMLVANMAAPSPPPLPATPAPDSHSALMESIRSGTTLKKVDVEPETKNDSRDELLTQIRQGISLRPVQPATKPVTNNPPENSLAGALARALAERSRVIHSDSGSSSEDEEEDDDEWED